MAQEQAQEEATPIPEVTQEEAVQEIPEPQLEVQAEPVSNNVKEFEYVDLLKYYFKTHDHKNKEEILWSILDPEYAMTKNNDFEYQKQKDKKHKEMQEIIKTSTDKDLALNTSIKLGPYDFKKEEFALQDVTHTTFALMSFETSLMKGEKIFNISSYGLDLEKDQIGNIANIKFNGFNKIKSIKVKKDIAEKVTARFGASRKVYCTMNFNNLKIQSKKTLIAKKAYYAFNGTLDFASGTCYYDDLMKEKAFDL